MPTRHSFAEIHLEATADREQPQVRPDPETPFRIAMLGDFSGRANRGLSESGDALASRRPLLIDRDNFDSVLAKVAPRLELASGGRTASASHCGLLIWTIFIRTGCLRRCRFSRNCGRRGKN